MAKTLKELATEALLVQDACNLVAVCNGMARAVADLREQMTYDEAYAHPITKLWADKVAHLSGTQGDKWNMANNYGEVKRLADE